MDGKFTLEYALNAKQIKLIMISIFLFIINYMLFYCDFFEVFNFDEKLKNDF
ncbi:hypothetical protein JCM30204_10280 [Dysgonomonas termitidis]